MSPIEAQQTISRELNSGETILWTGNPDPVRSMQSTLPTFIFGIVWTGGIINFIMGWHSGQQDISGPKGIFGMQGLLSDLFFVPFILAAIALLLNPLVTYYTALKTIYAITNQRVLIISSKRNSKVSTYLAASINMLERTDHANGTGTVTFNRASYRDSDGDSRSDDAKFIGIPDARMVEQLFRDTFKAPEDHDVR